MSVKFEKGRFLVTVYRGPGTAVQVDVMASGEHAIGRMDADDLEDLIALLNEAQASVLRGAPINKPLAVYAPVKTGSPREMDGPDRLIRCGAGFPKDDGSIVVLLDTMPLGGRLIIKAAGKDGDQ